MSSLAICCALWVCCAEPIVLNDDGGWCWFQDERAVVHERRLYFGSVANGRHDSLRKGSVEVTCYDYATRQIVRETLHARFQADDHDAPALLVRPDGRLLAVYCRHGNDDHIYYRISSRPGDVSHWGDEQTFAPSRPASVTYANVFRLASESGGRGRVYNFFRGHGGRFKPSWMTSDDNGETWTAGDVLIDFPAKVSHRPYVKYVSNNKDAVHFVFTEAHPRDFDNSLYHAYLSRGVLHRSDGQVIRPFGSDPIQPFEATRIFAGDANNVAWPADLHLDSSGKPVVLYSVQKDSANLPPGRGGTDHRYRYARWDGTQWHDHELAFAGRRLYAGEDDYTGGAALDPSDVKTVYISTSVDPARGEPHRAGHFELYCGRTSDGGATWRWQAVTRDSTFDNLRPIMPIGADRDASLLWLRGRYSSYTRYDLEVVLLHAGDLLTTPELP